MSKKWIAILCMLLLLPLCAAAQGTEPTPMPTPTSTPTPASMPFMQMTPESLISVQAYYDGGWHTMKSHMVYMQAPPMFADGMLHFTPLQVYVRHEGEKIATVKLTQEFDIRVNVDDGARSSGFSYAVYRVNGEELELYLQEKPVWTQLEDGLYLIEVSHSVSKEKSSYSGKSFLWLEI